MDETFSELSSQAANKENADWQSAKFKEDRNIGSPQQAAERKQTRPVAVTTSRKEE